MRAPQAWALGFDGTGIIVGSMDTGVRHTHEAVTARYRGIVAPPDPGNIHDYNWYDGYLASTTPIDQNGHGSHTMGTIVGGAAGGYSALGVAPGAKWIAARACAGLFCSDVALIKAAQWMLAPTNSAGTSPRPDLRPHIISNSWGKNGTDPWYLGYVTAWNAAAPAGPRRAYHRPLSASYAATAGASRIRSAASRLRA